MKKCLLVIFFLTVILSSSLLCSAANVDPILLNEPNENVFGCKNDVFIELVSQPTIGKVASGRSTQNYYIVIHAEILFLIENTWNGLDKTSFAVKHTDPDGNEELFPLNYAISMMANQKVSWFTFSEPYKFTDLRHTNLIFEVTSGSTEGWTLIFLPTERGANSPYCDIEIPLKVRY